MLDRSTNRSRGFGFVYFASGADLDEAIKVREEGERGERGTARRRAFVSPPPPPPAPPPPPTPPTGG